MMAAQTNIDFDHAKMQRDAGIARSLAHAESANEGWADIAYALLLIYARTHAHFISEDVSDDSKARTDFPQPPTDRAWGSVYRRAVKDRVIVQDGTGRSRRRHASLCPRWRSLICVEAA